MAERPQFRGPLANIKQIPAIRISSGNVRALNALSNESYRYALQVEDRMDTETQVAATRKAVVDGSTGSLNNDLLFSPTIAGRAYTNVALNEYERFQQTKIQSQMTKLAIDFPLDPEAFRQAADTYGKALLPHVPEEVRPRIAMQLDVLSQPHYYNIQAAQVKARQLATQAAVGERESMLHVQLQRYAGGVLSDNPDESRASTDAVLMLRTQIDALYSSTIEDSEGRKVPAFSPDKKIVALSKFDKMTTESAVKGWFLKQPNKIEAIRQWGRGNVKTVALDDDGAELFEFDPIAGNNQYVLDTTGIIDMTDWMRNQITDELTLEDKLISRRDRQREERDDEMKLSILQADGNERDELIAQLTNTTNDPDTIEWINTFNTKIGDLQATDPATYRATLEDINSGKLNNPAQLPKDGLSHEDYVNLTNTIVQRRNGNHMTNQPIYRDAVDFLWKTIAGESKQESRFAFNVSADKVRQRAEANRLEAELLQAAIEAQRRGETEFDPWEHVTTIIDKRAGVEQAQTTLNEQISELEARLERLRVHYNKRGIKPETVPFYKDLRDKLIIMKGDIE